jgi:hypothetical protein
LIVRLIGDDEVTVLEILVDDGLSRERIAGPLRVDVSLAEFRNAIHLKPFLIRPLDVDGKPEPRRIVLRSMRGLLDTGPASFSTAASGLMRAVSGEDALAAARTRVVGAPGAKVPAPAPAARKATPRAPPPRASARKPEGPAGREKRPKSLVSFERPVATIEFPEELQKPPLPDPPKPKKG